MKAWRGVALGLGMPVVTSAASAGNAFGLDAGDCFGSRVDTRAAAAASALLGSGGNRVEQPWHGRL